MLRARSYLRDDMPRYAMRFADSASLLFDFDMLREARARVTTPRLRA